MAEQNLLGDVISNAIPLAVAEIQRRGQANDNRALLGMAMGAGLAQGGTYGAPNWGAGMGNYVNLYRQMVAQDKADAYKRAALNNEIYKMVLDQQRARQELGLKEGQLGINAADLQRKIRETDVSVGKLRSSDVVNTRRYGMGGLEDQKLDIAREANQVAAMRARAMAAKEGRPFKFNQVDPENPEITREFLVTPDGQTIEVSRGGSPASHLSRPDPLYPLLSSAAEKMQEEQRRQQALEQVTPEEPTQGWMDWLIGESDSGAAKPNPLEGFGSLTIR